MTLLYIILKILHPPIVRLETINAEGFETKTEHVCDAWMLTMKSQDHYGSTFRGGLSVDLSGGDDTDQHKIAVSTSDDMDLS
jgi:hypothetical protein